MVNIKYSVKSSTLRILEKYSWWIQSARKSSPKYKKILQKIDNICLCCEQNSYNKNTLENKAEGLGTLIKNPKNYLNNSELGYVSYKLLDSKEQETHRQIEDFIGEIKAYDWLQNNGFENIYFVPVTNKKTPDLKGEKEEKLFFIEVKTLHIPREEENDLMLHYIKVKNPDFNHQNGLRNKINDYIEDSNKKFNDVEAKNRILIIYSNISGLVDISYIVKKYEPQKLDDILGEIFFKKKESEYNMEIKRFDSEN